MKNKKLKFSVLLLPLSLASFAQQGSAAAGGDGSGSGGSVAYSVGQVVYTMNTGTNGSANEGVQQPYEILTTEVKESKYSIALTAFPNPATHSLTLQIDHYNNEEMNYQLFDAQGKLLATKSITAKQTQIDMNAYAAGAYFINVIQTNQKIQSFKIIKK